MLLRDALGEEDLAKLSKRSRFRQATEAECPTNTGPPGSATSYAWLYTGLDGLAPYNVFHWSLTHQNSVIDGHLATYRGIFVGDACGANCAWSSVPGGGSSMPVAMPMRGGSSSRPKSNDPILASQAISFYRQLYDVEERAKTLDATARRELRQRDAVPIWNRMQCWLDSDAVKRALPRSAIGEAIGYLRNQWPALRVYFSDGEFRSTTTNRSRRSALGCGPGNWLFLGHPRAAAGRMQMYSVVSSAHRHHLVIDDYLEDVLRRLADAQQNHPADLALTPRICSIFCRTAGRWRIPSRCARAHRGPGDGLRREALATCPIARAGPSRSS